MHAASGLYRHGPRWMQGAFGFKERENMKILGMGIPELIIAGPILFAPLIAIIIVIVVVALNSKSKQKMASSGLSEQASQPVQPLSLEELERYAQLRDSGALSQEEFEAIKRRYLNS